MSILSDVLLKCKTAMRAEIPILYIKTDSYELIEQLVDSDELVMRLAKIHSKGPGEIPQYRPYAECKSRHLGHVFPDNVSHSLNDLKGLNISTWNCPRIITFAVKDRIDENQLEEYIKAYMKQYARDDLRRQIDFLHSSVLILYSSKVCLSEYMLQYTEVVDVGYPDHEELHSLVHSTAAYFGEHIEETELELLCSELQGFTSREAISAVKKVLTRSIAAKELQKDEETQQNREHEIRKIIRAQKTQKLQRGKQILKLITSDEDEIGGMENLVDYLNNIVEKKLMDDANMNLRLNGVEAPKGILLCGIPGCGKSHAAKLTAKKLGLQLLQLDMGNLMGSKLGESEENMRYALELAEAMSPCVLWIDELEKGFSGAKSSNNSDGGAFRRMFATLLNWMQENKKPCFIFATANDMGGLPKELFRSGRFDELFGVFLPTAYECADIFRSRVKKAVRVTSEERSRAGMNPLIETSALTLKFYQDIVNENLVQKDKLKILVGSDIQKIVNLALAEESLVIRDGASITAKEWKDALETEIRRCTTYGDSPENLDSIAVNYCRMLRKNLKPTVSTPLFRSEDYHADRALVENNPQAQENTTKKDENGPRQNPNPILKKRTPFGASAYDSAVYELLYSRIEALAPNVEKLEQNRLLEG